MLPTSAPPLDRRQVLEAVLDVAERNACCWSLAKQSQQHGSHVARTVLVSVEIGTADAPAVPTTAGRSSEPVKPLHGYASIQFEQNLGSRDGDLHWLMRIYMTGGGGGVASIQAEPRGLRVPDALPGYDARVVTKPSATGKYYP